MSPAPERRHRRHTNEAHLVTAAPLTTEAMFQIEIIELARILGWRVAHFRPAQTRHGWRTPVAADGKGFPDLVLVRERVIYAELKVGTAQNTSATARPCSSQPWPPDAHCRARPCGHSDRMSTAEQQRRWRASKGARTGQPGRPVTQTCGTVAAYRRHLRNGETPCAPCRAANADRSRQRRQ